MLYEGSLIVENVYEEIGKYVRQLLSVVKAILAGSLCTPHIFAQKFIQNANAPQ